MLVTVGLISNILTDVACKILNAEYQALFLLLII
jgi:hypothetical protein